MGSCLCKRRHKEREKIVVCRNNTHYDRQQQQQQQKQQHQQKPQQQQNQRQLRQQLQQEQVNGTNEDTSNDFEGSSERNDKNLTLDLLREAFDEDKCADFEEFLTKLNTIPKFCRIYSVGGKDKADGFVSTYFTEPKWYGGQPYYCPVGWRKYCLNLGMTQDEFEKEVGDWPIVYHGTDPSNVRLILKQGMKPSDYGCFLKDGERAIYLTPSIEYAGHPRYARIIKLKDGHYLQLCLKIRIHPSTITQIRPGTLPGAFSQCKTVDPNFKDNIELEWLIHWEAERYVRGSDGLVICGIMLRITKCHPYKLPQNKWWKDSKKKGFVIPFLNE